MTSRQNDAWTLSFVGQTLARRYRLTRVLGTGGVGAVFEAEHLAVGRRVAIKVLLPDMLEKESVVERFHREARAAAACARSGVVEVLDLDHDPVCGPFLVMEHLEGETLSDRLTRRGAMSIDEALSIALPILETLAAVHARGIVHRDLKPGNVFLAIGEHGRDVVKILDFGMARSPVAQDGAAPLTLPGSVLGTPRYMAPEQALGEPAIDARADLYAAGAILYTCLAGRPPYSDVSADRALLAVLTGAPRPLAQARPDLSPAVIAIVERAMARDPGARFPDAIEMLRVLRGASEPAVGSAPTLDLPALPTLGMSVTPSARVSSASVASVASSASIPSSPTGASRASRQSSSPALHPTVGARPASLRTFGPDEVPPTGAHATVPVEPAQLAHIASMAPSGVVGSGTVASPMGAGPYPAWQPWTGSSYAPGVRGSSINLAPPVEKSGRALLGLSLVIGVLAVGALALALVVVVFTRRDSRESAAVALPPPSPVVGTVAAPVAPSAPPVTSYAPDPAPEVVDAAIPPSLRMLLERGRAALSTGQPHAARDAYVEVLRTAPALAAGLPSVRALAYADLGLGDVEMAGLTDTPPITRVTQSDEVTSRLTLRGRAIEHYADAMRRGALDINVCATTRMGRADERLADVLFRVRAEGSGARPLVAAYHDMAPGFLRGARTSYQSASTLGRYSESCAADARAGLLRVEQRLAAVASSR